MDVAMPRHVDDVLDEKVLAQVIILIAKLDDARVRQGGRATGQLLVGRGAGYEANLARTVRVDGVNRRKLNESVQRLVCRGCLTCQIDTNSTDANELPSNSPVSRFSVTGKPVAEAS